MDITKIKEVLSENLGEGFKIVKDNGELTPVIVCVDWINQSEEDFDEENYIVEVHFADDTIERFEKGTKLHQIWNEDVK